MDPAGAGQAQMHTNGEGNVIFPQIAQIIADLQSLNRRLGKGGSKEEGPLL